MDIDTKVTQPSVEEEPSECSDAMEIKDAPYSSWPIQYQLCLVDFVDLLLSITINLFGSTIAIKIGLTCEDSTITICNHIGTKIICMDKA